MKLATALVCSLAVSASCALQPASGVKGSGVVIEETREVAPFDSIKVGGSLDVYLSQGEAGSLWIKAEDNLAPLVVATVRGSELTITTKESYSTNIGIEVFVSTASIRSIKASGSTDVLCSGGINADELELEASGSSDIECSVKVGSLSLITSGSSDIHISGSVDSLQLVATGASDVSAFDLVVGEADVKTSGAADASVNAKVLRAHASGASDIRYRGLPEKLTSSDRGAGSIGPEGT